MNNETQDIPRGEWAAFSENFSKQHQGATATLEAVGSDVGDQYAAENLPFVGMTLEQKGSGAGGLVLMLGTEGADHMERLVAAPQSLRVHVSPGGETVVEIRADGDPTLLLHLQSRAALSAP